MTQAGIERYLKNKLSETCKSYGVYKIPVLVISGRLKAANGTISIGTSAWDKYNIKTAKTPEEVISYIKTVKITISKHITEHFSLKTAEETLMHEIAHYFDYIFNKQLDHGTSFKKICVELGGTMNAQLAGRGEFAHAASAEFVSRKMGYNYECPCGKCKVHTLKRVQEKMLYRKCCRYCSTPIAKFKVTEL